MSPLYFHGLHNRASMGIWDRIPENICPSLAIKPTAQIRVKQKKKKKKMMIITTLHVLDNWVPSSSFLGLILSEALCQKWSVLCLFLEIKPICFRKRLYEFLSCLVPLICSVASISFQQVLCTVPWREPFVHMDLSSDTILDKALLGDTACGGEGQQALPGR